VDGLGSLALLLPEGRQLAEEVWQRRHRLVVRLAAVQALALAALGWAVHGPHVHQLVEALLVALPVPLAANGRLGRKARSAAATTSLFAASAVLVHLCSGLTEAHFHFFVMVGVVALYQDWTPFGVGLLITVVHHGVLGTVRPEAVYGSPGAAHHPWLWAGVHGGSVLAASLTHLSSWRLNEQQGLRDALTGRANRTLLTESLGRLLGRPTATASVLIIDLDDFKTSATPRGTRSATSCSWRSPTGSAAACGPRTSSPGWAGTSSRCSCPSGRDRPGPPPPASCGRSPTRSRSTGGSSS
jgi:diguanylate cyclase